jgi:hypothetical protein
LNKRAGTRALDWPRVAAVLEGSLGVPLPISIDSPAPEEWLARAPRVENRARGNFGAVQDPQLAAAEAPR